MRDAPEAAIGQATHRAQHRGERDGQNMENRNVPKERARRRRLLLSVRLMVPLVILPGP